MSPKQGKQPDWSAVENALESTLRGARHAAEQAPSDELLALKAAMRALDRTAGEQLGHELQLKHGTELVGGEIATRLEAEFGRRALAYLRSRGRGDVERDAETLDRLDEIGADLGLDMGKPLEVLPASTQQVEELVSDLREDEKLGRGEAL